MTDNREKIDMDKKLQDILNSFNETNMKVGELGIINTIRNNFKDKYLFSTELIEIYSFNTEKFEVYAPDSDEECTIVKCTIVTFVLRDNEDFEIEVAFKVDKNTKHITMTDIREKINNA